MTPDTYPTSVGATRHPILSETLEGVYFQPVLSSDKPVLVYYHGWSSSVERSLFRAQILAMRGHPVVVPELLYHGSRGVMTYDAQTMARHFWDVVMTGITEFAQVMQWIQNTFDRSVDQIGVVGHSMGGYIVAGLLTKVPALTCGVAYNASFNWANTNQQAQAYFAQTSPSDIPTPQNGYNHFDPIDDVTTLADRAIFMTNGELDQTVPMAGNLAFMEKIRPHMKDPDRIQHRIYENLGHFVNDHMLEDALNFIEKYLG